MDGTSRSTESYPLTPTQEGMLVNSLRSGSGLVEIEQIVVRLRHRLDVGLLRECWSWATARHDVLRTSFAWADVPRQVVHEHVALAFDVRDQTHLAPERAESDRARFLEEDRELGFDLSQPPLSRLTLFAQGAREHVLVWTFHHVILDGRSFTRVLEEVFDRYDARVAGRAYRPAPAPPFRRHCEKLAARDTTAEREFWTQQLRGLDAPTPVPVARTTFERDARRRHDEVSTRVSKDTVEQIRKHGESRGFSVANAVQGAWAIALSRYARLDDVCFGSTRAGRHVTVPEAVDMVGCLINTVPLRVAVPPEARTADWLRGLHDLQVAMRPHEQASLASMRGWAELPGGSPLFETLVVFERYLMDSELRARGGAWSQRSFTVLEQSDFALVLAAYQDEGDLLLRLEHDPVRCDRDEVARLSRHVACLLREIAARPDASLGELSLMDAEERATALADVGGGGPLLAIDAETWPEAFEARVREVPDRIALLHDGGATTYDELEHRAAAIHARLRAAGVRPGDVVATLVKRTPALPAALLGTLRAGAVYLPLDPAWPTARVATLIEDASAAAVIVTAETRDSLPKGTALPVIEVRGDEQPEARIPREKVGPEAPAYLLYTSGSTGKPKGVVVPHRALLAHARAIVPAYELRASDRCLQFTSPSFDVSLEEMLPTWLAGASVALRTEAAATSITTFLRELGERGVTVVNVPSAFFTEIAIHGRDHGEVLPEGVRLVIVGGEKPSPAAYAIWRRACPGPRFLNAYGPTEVTITSTIGDPVASGVPADGRTELPIGRPLGVTRAYVVDGRGEPCPIGVPGELWLSGAQVALGYLGREDLTAARFVADPFAPGERAYRTGDLVVRRADGDLVFLGRVDEQVKVRGYRIEPGEIETLLRADPLVHDVVVGTRPSTSGSPRLVAWVAASPGTDLGVLRARLESELPSYMVPSAFVRLDALPLTPSGKVDRRALPEPDAMPSSGVYVPPQGELETWLAGLYCELLGREQVGAEESFFDLGGHSLLAIRLLAQVNAKAAVPIELGTLFARASVRELARAMESGTAPAHPSLVALNRADPDAVPLFCICGVQLYAQLARAMEADRRVYGAFLPVEANAAVNGEALDVESMATAYVEMLQQERPHGPYVLGGVSFGGVLAYEMAQQLRARGESVALLALFDTILPRALAPVGPAERVRRHLRRLADDPSAFARHLADRFRVRVGLTTLGRKLAPLRDAAIDARRDIEFRRAAEAYDAVIRPYDGRVVLFRARDGLGPVGDRVASDLGWTGLVQPSTAVHFAVGTHLGILQRPGVAEIARILRKHLHDVDERPVMARTRRASTSEHPPPDAEE